MGPGASIAHRVRSTSLWLCVLVFFATLALWLAGVFVLDEGAKYGKVAVPGTAVLSLPQGEVDISFGAQLLSYGGSSNSSLPIPPLRYSVAPTAGGLVPGIESSFGATTSVNGAAHRRFARMDVPRAGEYRVQASGDTSGFFEPTLQFGAPNPAIAILVIGGSVFLGLAVISRIAHRVERGSDRSTTAPALSTSMGLGPAAERAAGGVRLGALAGPEARIGFGLLTAVATVLGVVALPLIILSGGSFHIAPQGRVAATAPASTTAPIDLTRAPLPRPTGTNVIGAADSGSLFKTSNLAPVIDALTHRLGARMSITNLALYPGEIDLVIDQSDGNTRLVRIERDGSITQGAPSPLTTGPSSIYLSQLVVAVPQLLADRVLARYRVPISRLDRMVLRTDLPGQNAGWQIYPSGQTSVTWVALLDGTGLRRQAIH